MNDNIKNAIAKVSPYKGYIVALVVLLVLIAIYIKRREIMAALGVGSSSTSKVGAASVSKPSVAPPVYTDDTVLKKGMRGDKVKELQELINGRVKLYRTDLGLDVKPLVVDGIFGSKTEATLSTVTNGKYKAISVARMKEFD